jgi:gamma-glutamyltranspeptidase/glutathione hydrolase
MFRTRRNEVAGFRSQRSMAMARRGMVCTSQTLASEAGIDVLRRGGNAIDAAVCAAAVLGVVEPFSTGIGGDCFLLFWRQSENKLYGLNGSGRAPAALSHDLIKARGHEAMPVHGMLPVTVPGAVHAWGEALSRFGRMSIGEVLQPAIHYAGEGFPVSEIIAQQWDLIVRFGVLQHPDAVRTFAPSGSGGARAPRLGEVFRIPALAATLEEIANEGTEAFYRGSIAERIVAFSAANDGVHSLDDFAAHESTWVTPISTDYRGYELHEMPPNTQGLAALMALNILENFDVAGCRLGSAQCAHLRIEAIKLAYADRDHFIADPDAADVPTQALLSKAYARQRASLLRPDRALPGATPGRLPQGTDTVYLTTADGEGNVVSLINSLYFPFGSGMVAGNTGIMLHNRGFGFVLDPAHANCVAPRKRPFHTIIPAMLFRHGRPCVSFGVMGGDVQAQAHVQVVSNLVDYGLNIQEALDFPRLHYMDGNRVAVEPDGGEDIGGELVRRGHEVLGADAVLLRGGFGGGQGIMIDRENGTLWGGSDRRKDGAAIGF